MSMKSGTDDICIDIRIWHPDATALEMTNAVGFPPDCVGIKGQPRGRSLWPFHYAAFSFGTEEPRKQLDAALQLLTRRRAEIASLGKAGGRVVLNVFAAPESGWSIDLETHELEVVASAGACLGLDVYCARPRGKPHRKVSKMKRR
jgi:hypothetical protein